MMVMMDGWRGKKDKEGGISGRVVRKIVVGVICGISGVFGVLVGKVGLEGIVYKHYFSLEFTSRKSEIIV